MAWDSNLDPRSPAYRIAADQSRFIRVLAGPGTGKSFALKRRVARLLGLRDRPAGAGCHVARSAVNPPASSLAVNRLPVWPSNTAGALRGHLER